MSFRYSLRASAQGDCMVQVVQACFATGWGGLEMVICDFHEWLCENRIDAKIICLENSPLHQNSLKRGFGEKVLAVPKGWKKSIIARKILKSLDSKETTFLFHRQQGAKWMGLRKLTAKKSILCHTFYGVQKKDPWHNFLFSQIDQWIVLTATQLENLKNTITVPNEKICIIPNGVDLQKFRPRRRSPKMGLHIGLIARLDPQKGQDIALRALKKLQRPDIFLHFFGEDTPDCPEYRPQLKALIEELGLQSNVIFEGYHEDMHKLIPEMDLIWMPSHQETFGRCLIEAMACKIPVIASAAGGVPDIIEEGINGLLFETKNPNHLAEKTRQIILDPPLIEKIAEEAYRRVLSQYDSEKIWQSLFDTIRPSVDKPALKPEQGLTQKII